MDREHGGRATRERPLTPRRELLDAVVARAQHAAPAAPARAHDALLPFDDDGTDAQSRAADATLQVSPRLEASAWETIAALRDTACDATETSLNSEDYEGMLVRVVDVKTIEERTAGQSFGVAGPYPTNPDTILIDNNITRTFDPAKGQYVTVTGVLEIASTLFAGSPWRIQPRNNADITTNPTLDVDPIPGQLSFAIAPNPSRSAHITFALPAR